MKKMFIIASFSMLLLSCQNNIQNVKPYKTGATIKLNIDTKSFAKKSNDASIPKTSADIKSYTAFLTTDKTKPFSQETFVSISVNKTDETSILFEEIPEGGPYYAVVAAFDDVQESSTKKNITQPNLDILNDDNEWNVSSNSVSVDENYNTTFEPVDSQSLNVTLRLKDSMPVKIDTFINVTDGIDNSNNYGAF